jgi:hypothetical protein
MKLKKSIILQSLGKRFVAYDNATSLLHEINETGAFIIKEIKRGKSKNDIIKSIMFKYEVENDVAKKDYLEFISLLEKKGIISHK